VEYVVSEPAWNRVDLHAINSKVVCGNDLF